jgi:ATP phosphoribosyltransferase
MVMLNVRRDDLDAVLGALPPNKTPTISSLVDKDWVDVLVVMRKSVVRDLIPELKERGARGIVELPLNKFIA